jgi:drug/metabolite transporter (DMT)-like permease
MCLFLLATGLVLLLVRCGVVEQTMWSWRVGAEVAYVAVGPTLLAYVGWDTAARRGNLSLVAAMSYLTPLMSVGISSLYLGLPIGPLQWLAGVLVVVGAVWCQLAMRQR